MNTGIEIEGGRLEKDSVLIEDSGIASGIVAVAAYTRGLGLHRRFRLVKILLGKLEQCSFVKVLLFSVIFRA